jgi:hypothetical protein
MTVTAKINEAPITQPPFMDPDKSKWHQTWVMWFKNVVIYLDALKSALNASLVQTYRSTGQTITSAGVLTLAHGLTVVSDPALINLQTYFVCVTGEHNYAAGDILRVAAGNATSAADNKGHVITVDATNITVRFGTNANVYSALDKTTGGGVDLTNAKWSLVVVAKY